MRERRRRARVRFHVEGDIAAPPDRVLALYHARLEEVAASLPEVQRVEVLERTSSLTRMKWFAQGDIPRAFHKVVAPSDLWWEDRIEYDFAALTATVHVHRPGLKNVRSESRVTFAPSGAGTRWRSEGELRIDVPLFGGMLERFFVGHVQDSARRFFARLGEVAAKEGGA